MPLGAAWQLNNCDSVDSPYFALHVLVHFLLGWHDGSGCGELHLLSMYL